MKTLQQEPDVARIASELGLRWQHDPLGEIIKYCLRKVGHWVNECGGACTLTRLEEIICSNLCLVFEEVWSDQDLQQIIKKYMSMGEVVFIQLRDSFDDETFATLLERRNIRANATDRYVAVIDCRGTKGRRRFFTRWHEIAHLLTISRQLELPFHRSTAERDPTERLMDVIAGEVGFYDPIFRPAIERELTSTSTLTFDGAERIRSEVCPCASFQATLIACIARAEVPLIYLEARMGLTKREQAELDADQLALLPMDRPTPMLRAIVANQNAPAKRAGFRIDRNMRVPEDSVIHALYSRTAAGGEPGDVNGIENLRIWRHSDGSVLGDYDVHVEARQLGDRVISLVRPLSMPAKRYKGKTNTQAESFFVDWQV